MIISEDNYVMLLVERFFKYFTPKDISDSSGSTEVIISITAESRGKVDDMVDKALEAGASKSGENQDNGWMYQRGFRDPDGHLWVILYMDMSSVPPN
jgi:predicted lactoylglutathione lyase